MRFKLISMIIMSGLVLSACGSDSKVNQYISGEAERGISASGTNEISGPSLEELEEKISNNQYSNIETMLKDLFPVRDVISEGSDQQVTIFQARDLTVEQLSDRIAESIPPQKASEIQNNEQIFIYPEGILTIKEDQNENQILLLEFATLDFVRDHYSPNYFNGFFALWVLDEVLDVDDWGKKRMSKCTAGNCYEGYPKTDKYRSGNVGSLRGASSNTRGGGPGSGK